jgi:tetratricopeptide (TPR) repeat protein
MTPRADSPPQVPPASGDALAGSEVGRSPVRAVEREFARQLIEQGNAIRDGRPGQPAEAIARYRQAIEMLDGARADLSDSSCRDDAGSAWTNQGIAGLMLGTPDGVKAAIRCLERAIEVREPLRAEDDPRYRYNLAGTWLNLGDALRRLDAPAELRRAIFAYDRTVEVMTEAGPEKNSLFRRRTALAWLNRGNAWLEAGGPADLPEVLRSLAAAAQLADPRTDEPSIRSVAASAHANWAEALGRAGSWSEAGDEAARAIALAAPDEQQSPEAAATGLKGRLCLCLGASRLWRTRPDNPATAQRLAAATDAAESGLQLVARWRTRPRLAVLAPEFFRLGAEAYAGRQPQFLVEFLREYLPLVLSVTPAGAARKICEQAIGTAIASVARTAFADLASDRLERLLATLKELREADLDFLSPPAEA